MLNRLLREPLFHFLLLGGGLFVLYYSLNGAPGGAAEDTIVVDENRLEQLASRFERSWMRPPTRQELEGLVENTVREEVFYREALALGLDQNDPAIRRRLAQKMEFISTDLADRHTADEPQLQAWLDAHADKFRLAKRTSFEHIFLKAGKLQAAEQLMLQLNGAETAPDDQVQGDPTLLPAAMDVASEGEMARVFGKGLAGAISAAPPGSWSGPYTSDFGLHLVRINKVIEGRMPALAEVRKEVIREWQSAQRKQLNESLYQQLRSRYRIEIQLPQTPAPASEKLVAKQ